MDGRQLPLCLSFPCEKVKRERGGNSKNIDFSVGRYRLNIFIFFLGVLGFPIIVNLPETDSLTASVMLSEEKQMKTKPQMQVK